MNTFMVNRPILLVEDNPADVDLTLRAFARRKLANPVEVARDGEEALAYLARWKKGDLLPLAILLDLKLPRVDGLEVLRHIRAHERFRTLPVVVLTSSADDRDIEAAYRLGANSYIVKPVDFAKFLEVAAQIELYWCLLNESPRGEWPKKEER
jgi:CheY-like chemotaxis protein